MTYNLTRDILELNSPDHIYQEWTNLSNKNVTPAVNQSFQKIPFGNQLEDAKTQLSCEFNLIKNMINAGDPQILYPSLLTLIDQIFDFVFEFNGIQSLKIVKELINKPDNSSSQARALVSKIKSSSEKVLFKQSLLKNHAEFLANPNLSHKQYWGILSDLMRELYNLLMEFITNIQQFSTSYIPIAKILMSSNPELSSSSVELFSPTQSQSQFVIPTGNTTTSSAVFYPSLNTLNYNQIPLNSKNNHNSRRTKYDEPIQKIRQLTQKLHQMKNSKKDDFTNIITTLCELNNLKSTFSDIYFKIHSMNPDRVLNLSHVSIHDLETMFNKKEKYESKITNAAQTDNLKEFNRYIDDYSLVVEKLLDVMKKCL